MEYNKARQLAEIIVKIRLRKASAAERAFLNDWLDESEANRQTYKRIVRGEAIARRLKAEEDIRNSADFSALTAQIARRLTRRRLRPWRIGAWGAVAAAFAGGLLYFGILREREPAFVPYRVAKETVIAAAAPNTNAKAMLVTADGREIDLEKQAPDSLDARQAVIRGEEGKLVYERKEAGMPEEKQEEWNKVVTSVGGEYVVELSDGTRVWLNANTTFDFPVDFVRQERVVKLRGEAYFEVAKDAKRPFIVETEGTRTRVLGTSFNVKAYPDERYERTTLLEGSVEITLAESTGTPSPRMVLEPGMQARWETGSRSLSVRAVDAEDAIAWRRGEFLFTEEDIQVVLQTLSRWYGVEFVSTDEKLETYTFSGMMSKDDKLGETLEILTLAGGPAFRIEGDKVYMSKKKSGL